MLDVIFFIKNIRKIIPTNLLVKQYFLNYLDTSGQELKEFQILDN